MKYSYSILTDDILEHIFHKVINGTRGRQQKEYIKLLAASECVCHNWKNIISNCLYQRGVLCYADKCSIHDDRFVLDYLPNILHEWRNTECDAMPGVLNIESKIRRKRIDFMFMVQANEGLVPETLFIAVNILDRYIVQTSEHDDLVCLGAIFIACKYEETVYPDAKCLAMYSKECGYKDIIRMESTILATLNFRVMSVSSFQWFGRFMHVSNKLVEELHCKNSSKQTAHIAAYIIELSLYSKSLLKHRPSLKSAAAIYAARKLVKISAELMWPRTLQEQTGYSASELESCATRMHKLLSWAKKKSPAVIFSHKLAFNETSPLL